MIFNLFFEMILAGVVSVFSVIPTAKIVDIPVIGGFMSSALIQVSGLFHSFLILFPFALVVWHAFLWVLLFEGILLVAKFFLGHHVPANMN